MREQTTDLAVAYAIALLSHYGFELRGYTAKELVDLWLKNYSAHWVRLGVIEALYQGRYKAVSVDQILSVWARRGQPIYRFTHEFERLISRKLPQNLTAPLEPVLPDPDREPNLPPLPPSSTDTTTENAIPEVVARDPVPIDQQDTAPTASIPNEELTETPVQTDEPSLEALSNVGVGPAYNANWSRCEVKKEPIHQFTPPPDASDFYLKLKAVVQQQEDISPKVAIPIPDESELDPPRLSSEKN